MPHLVKPGGAGDFKVVNDGGRRRVSVFGMGWTGYALAGADEGEGELSGCDLSDIARFVVRDGELVNLAYYFYELGKLHGAGEAGAK